MEINGRGWGSLPLAISSGIDFPADLYRLVVHNDRGQQRSYRPGSYSRKLTEDLYWFADNWRADHSDDFLLTVARSRAVREWGNVLLGRQHLDSFAVDDPRPWLREVHQLTTK